MKVDPYKLTKLTKEYLIETAKLHNVFHEKLANIVNDYVSLYNSMIEYELSLDKDVLLSASKDKHSEVIKTFGIFTELLLDRYENIKSIDRFISGNKNGLDKIKECHESHMNRPHIKLLKIRANPINIKE